MSCRHFLRSRGKCTVFSSDRTIFIPFTVTMVPNYITLSDMGLVDSIYGVALPQLADATRIFLLRQSQERAVIPVTIQYHEDYGSRVGYYFTVNGTDVISIMREDILQGRSQAYWKVDQHTLHFFDKATEANIGYPEE